MEPASRLLRLLSLLQSRPVWPASELAERLEVDARTIRRDIARLRSLGYPVNTKPGEAGYQLGAGGRLPPLLLDDDEAVAIALGLRLATTASVAGVESSAIAALAKLDQVLPAHIRERVHAIETATVHFAGRPGDAIDADTLLALATGCRGSERVRFSYVDYGGNESERRVEPLQIVHTGKRWYLVAMDCDRNAWRNFRVDRIRDPVLTGHRFTHVDPPDARAMVLEGTTVVPFRIEATILLDLTLEDAKRQLPPQFGVFERADGSHTLLRVGGNEISQLAGFVATLPCGWEVLAPIELRREMRRLGRAMAARHITRGSRSARTLDS